MRVDDLGGGVHRITHPLPWGLDHVHTYAIEDADGWTIVDAGLGDPGARERWTEGLAALGRPQVRRIVVTHFHPDHIGGSRLLAELTAAEEVVQGGEDAAIARRNWGDDRDVDGFSRYLLEHGAPEWLVPGFRSAAASVALAEPTRRVEEGDVVEIGGETYKVLVLRGHADGHIALLGEHTGRLFGGDVLLQTITPNVGAWPGLRPDPLADYLETLERLAGLDTSLVYPGHHGVLRAPAERAAEIRAHHAVRLDAHVDALRDGEASTYEVSERIWPGRLSGHERRFALAEALAHLIRLERLGRVVAAGPGRWASA